MDDCNFELIFPLFGDRKSERVTCVHGRTLSVDSARRALALPKLSDEDFILVNKRLNDIRIGLRSRVS